MRKRITPKKTETEKKEEIEIDERHPFYIGFWKKSKPYEQNTFAYDIQYDEPHAKRKKTILEKYPEIKKLYGISEKTKYIIMLVTLMHILGCIISTRLNNLIIFTLFCYFYGGSLSALSGILMHECTHDLVSENRIMNVLYGYLANLPILLPASCTFSKYHLDHHNYLGIVSIDPDLPLDIEIRLVKGSKFSKMIYISFYPILYVIRSMFIKKEVMIEEIYNICFHLGVMFMLYHFLGFKCLIYWFFSTWFGYSIHPAAAHLIQEHFTFADGQETYSYYGPFNRIFLNIGYHNEHHDFSNVSWDRLPLIKKIAPEFYDCFFIQTSWFGLLYHFITKKVYGPQSRVVRTVETADAGRTMKIVVDLDRS